MNRGGLLVEVDGISAFLPSGQMVARTLSEELIGTKVACRVIEANPETGRLVVSNRKAVDAEERKQHSVGDLLLGTVQSVQAYGAFIDLAGGGSGLLHISEVSGSRVESLDGVLAVGDVIKVMVHKLAPDGKLSLSTKKLEPAPGDMLKNPKKVFDKAEEVAAAFKARMAVLLQQAADGGGGAPFGGGERPQRGGDAAGVGPGGEGRPRGPPRVTLDKKGAPPPPAGAAKAPKPAAAPAAAKAPAAGAASSAPAAAPKPPATKPPATKPAAPKPAAAPKAAAPKKEKVAAAGKA